jgi:hypothetical protein
MSLFASLDLIWDTGDFGKIGFLEKKGRKRAKMTLPKSVTMSGLWGWPDLGKSGKCPKKAKNRPKKDQKPLPRRVKINGFGGSKSEVLGVQKPKKIGPGGPKSAKKCKNAKSDPNLFCEH